MSQHRDWTTTDQKNEYIVYTTSIFITETGTANIQRSINRKIKLQFEYILHDEHFHDDKYKNTYNA